MGKQRRTVEGGGAQKNNQERQGFLHVAATWYSVTGRGKSWGDGVGDTVRERSVQEEGVPWSNRGEQTRW